MAGIADVQPISISPAGPLVGQIAPAATPAAVEQLSTAFRQGFITTDDVIRRAQEAPVEGAKRQVALQEAKEVLSPEAVQMRAEQRRLTTQKSQAERETMLSKDFVDAYLRYNLPLKKSDGTPDFSGMAEAGQKYADTERLLKYAEMGLTGKPVQFKNALGQTITKTVNVFGEDLTETDPNKPNKILREYQTMARKARSYLLQNDDEPEVPEGKAAPVIQVSPKQMTFTQAPPAVDLTPERTGVFPVVTAATPVGLAPRVQDVAPAGAIIPQVVPVQPGVSAVAPAVVKPVVTVPAASAASAVPAAPEVSVAPTKWYGGEGMVTDLGPFDPDKYVTTDVKGGELYKNWAQKSEVIEDFYKTAASYENLPPGSITTQKDIALATQALMLAMPGQSAGGRGPEGLRLTRLEDAQPYIEKWLDLPAVLLKEHKFTKGTRDRIIQAAKQKAEILEAQGKGALDLAYKRLIKQGYDPKEFLSGKELSLIAKSSGPSPSGASAGVQGPVYSIGKGGRKVFAVQR